jgi:hypothetical protein
LYLKIPYLCIIYNKMVFKIYGLYDKEDNLRYIGYTSKSLDERLKTHLATKIKKGKQCYRICWLRSLDYIPTIKLIDESNTLEEILSKEIYWINYYKSLNYNLVNTCEGGMGSNGHKWSEKDYLKRCLKVKQYDTDGNLLNIFNSLSEASEAITGTKKYNGKISQCCKGKRGRRTFYNFVMRYENDEFNKYPITGQYICTEEKRKKLSIQKTLNNPMKNKIGKLNKLSKPVNKLDDNKNIIETFESIRQAELITKTCGVHVAINKNVKRGGFYWEYANKDIVQSS